MNDARVEANRKSPAAFFQTDVGHYVDLHYGENAYSLMGVRLTRFLQRIDSLSLPAGSTTLDAGCGPGHLRARLAQRGFRAWGLDLSAEMLCHASSLMDPKGTPGNARLQRGSIEHLPYRTESFDLLCSAGVIEYLPTDVTALSEFARVLKPGGYAVLSVTNRLSPIGWADGLVEAIKQNPVLLGLINRLMAIRGEPPARARHFSVRRHAPGTFRKQLGQVGLEPIDDEFFYMLPWPHPFDRLFPRATAALGKRLEPTSRGRFGILAEGYLVVARKAS